MLPVVGGLLCGVNRCSRWAQKRNSSLSEMVNRSSEDRIERLLQSLSRVAGYERGNFGGDGGLRADLHRSSALHVVAQRTLDLFRARATFAAAVLATGLVGSVLLFSGAVGLVGLVGTVYMAGRCADAISMVPSAEMALGEAVDADAKQRQLLAIPPEEEGDVDLDPMIERGVMFDGVEFGYAPTQSVLRGVTFKLDAGTRVAVVGRSGSGKSTLGKLVTGELFPTYGDVRLDHVPTTRIDPAARQRVVAGVPQTPRFIAGRTIMQMLLPQSYWQPTDRQRALELCNRAGLAELLAKRGIDRGVLNPESFSGGEAKRLATVRALLRNPDVLVLDELMSSLDVETRRDITDLIDQARTNSGERPAVLDITHDLDSIGPSDHVVMLDRGVVVDEGTYRGLIQNGGPFADFAGIRSPWLGRSVPTTGSGYGNVPGLGLGVTWSDVGAGASTGSR
jgi:ABC-type multidrug transport system fused ATPase/permease subunit